MIQKGPPMSYLTSRCYLVISSHQLLCGNIERNPGPGNPKWRFPCGKCSNPVKSNQHSILCDLCQLWFHCSCIDTCMSLNEYNGLSNSDEQWFSSECGCDVSSSVMSVSLVRLIVLRNQLVLLMICSI